MAGQPLRFISPTDYLTYERQAETKSEYWAGEIYAMSGASARHNIISLNVGAEFRTQLKSRRSCTVYPSDMRVKVEATGLYTYPDVVVVCGRPQFEDSVRDTLLNPTVLVEVLSNSTERYDRGAKFQHYRQLASLAEYLLIAQNEYRIEHYLRQPDQQWLLTEATDLQRAISLPSIECTLALAEVYDKVELPPRPRLLKEPAEVDYALTADEHY